MRTTTFLSLSFFLLLLPFLSQAQYRWDSLPPRLIPNKERIAQENRKMDSVWKSLSKTDETFSAGMKRKNPDNVPYNCILSPHDMDVVVPVYKLYFYLSCRELRHFIAVNLLDLWHPRGHYWEWIISKDYFPRLEGQPVDKEAAALIKKLTPAPYLIEIHVVNRPGKYNFIGRVEDGRLFIYDRSGNRYAGLDDFIKSEYGSEREFIKEYKARRRKQLRWLRQEERYDRKVDRQNAKKAE